MRTTVVILSLFGLVGVAGCADGGPSASEHAIVKSVQGTEVCAHAVSGGDDFCTDAPDTRSLQGVAVGDCVDMNRELGIPDTKIEVRPTAECR